MSSVLRRPQEAVGLVISASLFGFPRSPDYIFTRSLRGLACSLYGLSACAGCLGIPMPSGL